MTDNIIIFPKQKNSNTDAVVKRLKEIADELAEEFDLRKIILISERPAFVNMVAVGHDCPHDIIIQLSECIYQTVQDLKNS